MGCCCASASTDAGVACVGAVAIVAGKPSARVGRGSTDASERTDRVGETGLGAGASVSTGAGASTEAATRRGITSGSMRIVGSLKLSTRSWGFTRCVATCRAPWGFALIAESID